MYPIAINQNNIYRSQKPVTTPVSFGVIPPITQEKRLEEKTSNQIHFGETAPAFTLRTELTTKEEQEKYMTLVANLDKKERKNLEALLKTGILLDTNSNDKSSTLDNLYKIVTTPRTTGLNPQEILKEAVNTIANPFIITQNFGDIPKPYVQDIIQNAKSNPKTPDDKIDEKSINVTNSSACVSASIEFNLAYKMPAEFARFAEGLTSPQIAVSKEISLNNLTDKTLDSVYLLNSFEIPYEMKDFDKAKITLSPDKNAIIRAQIQNSNKDYMERSLIDVLMQSTFMNVGSQQTYDSLTDLRGGKFSSDNRGLIEFEKTFTESVVYDKNKTSITYQNLDENGKLIGYTTDLNTMKKHILNSLAMGENVIIGYTEFDGNKQVINGHEITIIGVKQEKNGKLKFICNDTDDNKSYPIEYSEDYILPKIHHAGLPQQVVAQDEQFVDSWKEGLNAYKEAKK